MQKLIESIYELENRGLIVEAPPLEDMDRRKELVPWTRNKVSALIGRQSG